MHIVPNDKFDFNACENLSIAEDREVLLKIEELFSWLQDANWPVYHPVLKRLLKLETGYTHIVKTILRSNDGMWKYWVMTDFIAKLPPLVIQSFEKELESLVKNPSTDDKLEEVNIEAEALLKLIS